MNIDLMKDLKKAAEDRKIRSSQWMEESPFDAIMEEGFKEKMMTLVEKGKGYRIFKDRHYSFLHIRRYMEECGMAVQTKLRKE